MKNKRTTLKNLREYGKFLGIKGLYGKNKQALWDHIFDRVHEEVNERMLRKPALDPERAYMEAALALRAKKLTEQKTWKSLHEEARANNISINRRRMKKNDVERAILNNKRKGLFRKYRKNIIRLETLKSIIENESRLLETALGSAYRSHRIDGPRQKTNINYYIKRIKPHVYNLIKRELGDLKGAKIQITIWIRWYKDDIYTMDEDDNLQFGPIIVDKAFNSRITVFNESDDIDELLEDMFDHIKQQTEHPKLPQSGFRIEEILYTDINFHKNECVI
ncbi:MAG: hypothetical protein J4F36_14275, partial [Nitrosopumilaceae archaeon]|nr:hypothetical protein [Nitrosopumilaceae archaeon]